MELDATETPMERPKQKRFYLGKKHRIQIFTGKYGNVYDFFERKTARFSSFRRVKNSYFKGFGKYRGLQKKIVA